MPRDKGKASSVAVCVEKRTCRGEHFQHRRWCHACPRRCFLALYCPQRGKQICRRSKRRCLTWHRLSRWPSCQLRSKKSWVCWKWRWHRKQNHCRQDPRPGWDRLSRLEREKEMSDQAFHLQYHYMQAVILRELGSTDLGCEQEECKAVLTYHGAMWRVKARG